MNENQHSRARFSRRSMLGVMALSAAAISGASLTGCGVGGKSGGNDGEEAKSVTGSFDWKKAKGEKISILLTPHRYQEACMKLIPDFTAKTGIEVNTEMVPEAEYFTRLNTELSSKSGNYDVFMLGSYFIWVYGPPKWMENLKPWIENSSATSDEYKFDDIFAGLRKATSWDFKIGNPLGTGGQWAIPWGFETNVVTYNKKAFDAKGIKPAETWEEFQDLAVRLTDRKAGKYGVAMRGSKSWATIHPAFITLYSRLGCKDYLLKDGKLKADMNSSAAMKFTKEFVDLVKKAGPVSWTTYEYPDNARDLGNGLAYMVFDADGTTFNSQKPGGSKQAGNLAWYAGPAGPSGNYNTNMWTWALGMNANSKKKLPAWLFLQWITSAEAMNKAVAVNGFTDPTRKSVFDGSFKKYLEKGNFPGYIEAFEKVIDKTSVQFTPQTSFFETTEAWAAALQDIYAGKDAKTVLDKLAQSNTKIVNGES